MLVPGLGAASSLKNSSRSRSGETDGSPLAAARIKARVSLSIRIPNAAAMRTARMIRTGSEENDVGEQALTCFAIRSAAPPNGSSNASGWRRSMAIALMVKSRAARSLSISPP